jgi:pyruvate/2-oxoglutarate dehydrogenase complex dihydrolipoamide acyltransferase (E2) component
VVIMGELRQFKLPDVGEGLTEADIVKWHVRAGDAVHVNQVIVEVETVKVAVELPCPYEGTVTELLVDEGSTVAVGTPIITVAVEQSIQDSEPDVLVGYGVKPGATTRRVRPGRLVPVPHRRGTAHASVWLQVDVTGTVAAARRLPESAGSSPPSFVASALAHVLKQRPDIAITLTDMAGFGMDAGSPAPAPGEPAVLAMGRIRDMPWVHRGEMKIRAVTTLVLTFDDRVLPAEIGSAILRDIAALIEDP